MHVLLISKSWGTSTVVVSSCARPQQLAEQVYLVHKYSLSFLHRKGYYGPEVLPSDANF